MAMATTITEVIVVAVAAIILIIEVSSDQRIEEDLFVVAMVVDLRIIFVVAMVEVEDMVVVVVLHLIII